jgi:hypothetical protein
MTSDEALLAATARDPRAFGEFYARHERAVFRYFYRRVRDAERRAHTELPQPGADEPEPEAARRRVRRRRPRRAADRDPRALTARLTRTGAFGRHLGAPGATHDAQGQAPACALGRGETDGRRKYV